MNRYRRLLHHVWERLAASALVRRGRELELMHRAMGFATLALVTLAPLLIVVAAADPLGRGGSRRGWPTAWGCPDGPRGC